MTLDSESMGVRSFGKQIVTWGSARGLMGAQVLGFLAALWLERSSTQHIGCIYRYDTSICPSPGFRSFELGIVSCDS